MCNQVYDLEDPFLIFTLILGYVSYWHLIPLLPAFCIAAALLVTEIPKGFNNRKVQKLLPYAILCAIGLFGFIITTTLIGLNLTSFHYQVISFLINQIQNANTGGNDDGRDFGKLTILGRNYWLWIPKYLFDKNHTNDYVNYYNEGEIRTKKLLFVGGEDFIHDMVRENDTEFNTKVCDDITNSTMT